MLFFTRAWLHDEEQPDARAAYEARIQELGERLPTALREFIRTVSLHDGRLLRMTRANEDLSLGLRVGDEQVGYFDLVLVYRNLCRVQSDLAALRDVPADPIAEVLYDEFDVIDGMVVHRILFASLCEVALVASAVEPHLARVPSRDHEFRR